MSGLNERIANPRGRKSHGGSNPPASALLANSPTADMKKLYRSEQNKIFGGIIGGLGEYFEIDPVLLRLIWLIILIATGIIPGLIVYIIALFIVPRKN